MPQDRIPEDAMPAVTDTPQTPSREESDLGEAVALLAEILDNRAAGNTNTLHGNGDEDLDYALEAAQDAARAWRTARTTAGGAS